MVVNGHLDQIFVGFRCACNPVVTAAAGKVQRDLGYRQAAIRVELGDLVRIDRHDVATDIAGENLGIAPGVYDGTRHVTLSAGHSDLYMQRVFLELGFLEMAVFARGGRGGFFYLTQLHNPAMRVMTGDTLQDIMLA